MGSPGLGWALISMTTVLIRNRRKNTETQGDSHVTTEAEVGVKWPQAEGYLGHQELEEAGRTLPFLPLPEGAQPC